MTRNNRKFPRSGCVTQACAWPGLRGGDAGLFMSARSGGCGSGQRYVRHQCASNVEVDPFLTTVDRCQSDRNGGAGGDRLEEFGAVNSLALERRDGERFEPMQALGEEQNPWHDRCPGEMTLECRVIGGNVKRSGHACDFSGGGAHLSTAP